MPVGCPLCSLPLLVVTWCQKVWHMLQAVQPALPSTQREPGSQLQAFRLARGQMAHSPSLAAIVLHVPIPPS